MQLKGYNKNEIWKMAIMEEVSYPSAKDTVYSKLHDRASKI